MSKLKNLIKRNQFKATIGTGVLLLIMGIGLWLYANSVIQGHEQLLNNPDLTPEETWRYEGSLQWWRIAYTTTFHPLAVILITIGLNALLCPILWAIIQKRRALKTFTDDLIRASTENSKRSRCKR